MSERGGLIPSSYFDARPDLALGDDEIVVVCCMRDELLRLPYFLEYYRQLGVDRFLLIDNDSTDGTREYLAGQPDVEYFHTDTSYLGSANGRMWVQEVAETYATGHWVLFADVDELFVYPGVELFGIHDFCRYLDNRGHEGVFALLLDLYSDVPLEQTRYRSGTDFRETCRFFEVDSYRLRPAEFSPFVSVWGGPRGRLSDATDDGPKALFQQRKIPLVKWRRGFSYVIYAHDARYLPLADVTGALLHFKYFSTWIDRLEQDQVRGDRNPRSYAFYANRADRDLCFYGSHSLRYADTRDLLRLGVLAASGGLKKFYAGELRSRGEDPDVIDAAVPASLPAEGGFTLRSIAAVWPFVNNPNVARYFGQFTLSKTQRNRLVHELSEGMDVVDVWADGVLLRLGQQTLHHWHAGEVAVALYVDGKLLDTVKLDDTASNLQVETDSLISNVYRWKADIRGAQKPGARRSKVEVFFVDAATTAPDADESAGARVRVFSRQWFHERVATPGLREIHGAVEGHADGDVRGWAFHGRSRSFDLPIAIYVDGRLVSFSQQTVPRPDVAAEQGEPESAGRGFRSRLPLGYFRSLGAESVRVDVRIGGTNVDLAGAPLELSTDSDGGVADPDDAAPDDDDE